MLNKKARNLINYDRIVEDLAGTIPSERLDELETKDLQVLLGVGYENWDFQDWYRLLKDIRRIKRRTTHETMTAKTIFNGLPWAAQQAAQEAVRILIKEASMDRLYKSNEIATVATNILWSMFYCMAIDIKKAAEKLHKENKTYSDDDLNDNKQLLDFIEKLRDEQWYGNGEVARLRCKE